MNDKKVQVDQSKPQSFTKLNFDFQTHKELVGGKCRHIAFDGVKGGSGKTTLCCNIAIMAAHFYGKKVMVVDLDLNMAASSIALMSRNELLKQMYKDEEDMSYYGKLITVVRKFSPTEANLKKLIADAADYDYCIYDGGGYSSQVSYTIGSYCDLYFCPLKPDRVNMRSVPAIKHTVQTINFNRQRFGHPPMKALIILNHLSNHANSIKNREAKEYLDKEGQGLFLRLKGGVGIGGYEAFERIHDEYLGVSELFDRDDKPVYQLEKLTKGIMKLLDAVDMRKKEAKNGA